jgi:hypothetical protein
MHHPSSRRLALLLATSVAGLLSGADFSFRHHFIDRTLPVTDRLVGDGKPDIVASEQEELLPAGRENPRWVIWENHGGNQFTDRVVLDTRLGGHELQVGDVDGDGDVDICSKPWGPRPWNGSDGKMLVDFLENLLRTASP